MWSLLIPEGRSYDIMLRAAQLALAVDPTTRTFVNFEKDDAYAPWRHLLEPHEQLRLRALGEDDRRFGRRISEYVDIAAETHDNSNLEHWRKASDDLQATFMQAVWCRPGVGVQPHPPAHTWLWLTQDAARADPARLRRYERVLAVAPYGLPPGFPGVVAVPPAVHTQIFTPDGTPPSITLLVIASGQQDVDIAFVKAWLRSTPTPTCALFDPYHSEASYRHACCPPL